MNEFTVTAEATGSPGSPLSISDEDLEEIYESLRGRRGLLGPVVSANIPVRRVELTGTVWASDQNEANRFVAQALGEALMQVGQIGQYATSTGYVVA